MNKICFATNNKGKIAEVKSLLQNKFEIVSLQDIGCVDELPETGSTIEENSLQKAKYVFDNYKVACFADDSGLEIDALLGLPGVDSAHYAGSRDNDKNIALVLENLKPFSNKSANFKTVITYYSSNCVCAFEGLVYGKIIDKPIGNQGFGYDPIFVPNGYNVTFGEMMQTEKNIISHRAIATKKLIAFLEKNNF